MLEFDAQRNERQAASTSSARQTVLASEPLPLVLGFGNVLLCDDGAGVRLTEQLNATLGPEAGLFVDGGTMSFSLLPYIEATDSLLVIDAADLRGVAGEIGLFEGVRMDDFLRTSRRRTVHEIGLIDLMDMARLRDCLPSRRALLCIQPCRIDWGEALSPSVATALPDAARLATDLLHRWTST